MKWISPAGVCGMLIIALSASVMLGLAAYIANPVEMTFNSAACFFLTGIALLFADDRPDLRSPLYTIIGACILLTALLTLLERHLHSGNPFDNTVIGLIPTSICILSLPFMNKHWVAACVQFLLF